MNSTVHQHSLPADVPGQRSQYLNLLMSRTGKLTLTGIDPMAASDPTAAPLSLSAVYTALLTGGQSSDSSEKVGIPKLSLQAPALQQLNDHRLLVLMGEPGSGKSTFVNFVALCLAGACLQHPTIHLKLLTSPLPDDEGQPGKERQPWAHGALLPVLVVLRDLAARGLPEANQEATAHHLWQFMEQEFKQAGLAGFERQVQREWGERGGMLLLDGLDEVSEGSQRRQQIKQMVEQFVAMFPKVRVLVTSRTYAYQKQDWRLPDFREAVLAAFSQGQIIRFITAWYEQIAPLRHLNAEDARGRAEQLREVVLNNERLLGLAERPLLLTLMSSLHAWRGGSLPERREQLYADTVDLLLDWWESPKTLRGAAGQILSQQRSLAELLKVGREKVRGLLQELAYKAHASQAETRGTADVTESELITGLMRLSRNVEEVNPVLLVEYLSYRAGLLLPRAEGVYTFPHRTFQEYLAACYLADYGYPDEVARLACDEPGRWREVALLAGAKTARGGAFALWPLVNALCCELPKPEGNPLPAVWGGQLAGQALAETADLSRLSLPNQQTVQRVQAWLEQIVRGSQLPAVERALAAASLARLGETRRAVLEVDQMELCWVNAGEFLMGSNDGEGNEKQQHPVTIAYPCWMGRYPVTNAQFGQFVADGGYQQAALWTEAKDEQVWQEGQVKGWYSDDWRSQPRNWGTRYRGANQPVIGVTWYEAVAFCRWLMGRWQDKGWLPKGWGVQLPSEAEWEKAARGAKQIPTQPMIKTVAEVVAGLDFPLQVNQMPQRGYPWGEGADPEKANYDKSGIGVTSGVGCFAAWATPYGCEEMSGNVWEWTRSRYQNYPYRADDGRERLKKVSRYDSIIIRGGAFYSNEGRLRCASRYWDVPYYDYYFVGFRVVVSPFPSHL